MNRESLLTAAGRWFRQLLWLYPPDFRDDLGLSLTEAYKDRASAAFERSGAAGVAAVCIRALLDALWNGPAERLRPSGLWRQTGHWARDAELASRRLLRAPAMALAIVGTLTIGLGMVAVVYAVVHKILIEPMPYREPDDLYFVWQVALTLVLLCSGGLVVRSFERLLRADPGFKPDGLLTFRVPIPPQFVPEARDVLALQERVEQAFATLPGVLGVSATSALPLTASSSQNTVTIPGAPGITGNADKDRPLVDYMGIRARYVEVLGMRLVSGRSFEAVRRNGVREALIDVSLARQFFPTGDPLGATIPFGRDQSLTVVGVVEQARLYSVHQDGRPQLYVRAEDFSYRTLSFVVRSHRNPQALIPDVQAAVRRIDPRLAVADLRTMDQIVSDALRQQRVSTVLIVSFALGALILATMGLFGVVSGLVTRRRHEFAVRLALGADHRDVVRMVLRGGARLVAVGVLIGAPGVYLAGLFLRGILVGVSPLDPLTLTIITGGLVMVALAACYVPARRLLALNPAQSLRQ